MDIGEPVHAYLCHCGAWHVGRGESPLPPFPLWDTVAFRSVDLWIELGQRATANMKAENFGGQRRRQLRLAARQKAATRRRDAKSS
jgi:hypothetical protein